MTTVSEVAATMMGFQALFWTSFEDYEPYWPMVSRLRTSTKSSEQYHFATAIPGMEEWIGPRAVSALNMQKFRVVNKDFAQTIRIPYNDFMDLELGDATDQFSVLGAAVASHPDELISELRNNGKTEKCYDDHPFYSATHESGNSGQQSNIITRTGDTQNDIKAAIYNARARMRKFKNDQGRRLYRMFPKMGMYLHITHPPELAEDMEAIAYSPMLVNDTPNPLAGHISLYEDPDLSDNNDFMIDYVGMPAARPFIKQDREPIVMYTDTDPRSFLVRTTKEIEMGLSGRYNAAYWLWFTSVLVQRS